MASITWDDKNKNNLDGVHNKWRDEDANQVKTVINSKLDAPPSGKRVVVRCGDYNATTVQFPSSGGTGIAGAVELGNKWRIVTGSVDVGNYPLFCDVEALVDAPGQTPSNWRVYY